MYARKSIAYAAIMNVLRDMEEHPEKVSAHDESVLEKLYKMICKVSGVSEHSKWQVRWDLEKWHSLADKVSGVAPYEVLHDCQNIILDNGANEMLKLICGTGGTAYNTSNTKLYVGTSSTDESASQTALVATGSNLASASMDSGYPIVSGRAATFRASFDENTANFDWKEAGISNGSVFLNRKVANMGTKNGGVWTLQMTVNILSM